VPRARRRFFYFAPAYSTHWSARPPWLHEAPAAIAMATKMRLADLLLARAGLTVRLACYTLMP